MNCWIVLRMSDSKKMFPLPHNHNVNPHFTQLPSQSNTLRTMSELLRSLNPGLLLNMTSAGKVSAKNSCCKPDVIKGVDEDGQICIQDEINCWCEAHKKLNDKNIMFFDPLESESQFVARAKVKNIYKMKVTINESPSEPNKQVKCEYFVLLRFENPRRATLSCFLEYAQLNLGLELHWESHWWNATSFFRKQAFHLLLLINKTIQGIAQDLGKCFCLFVCCLSCRDKKKKKKRKEKTSRT